MGWIGFLTLRHLGSPLKRGLRLVMILATLGVALGVATLTLTQAVSRGLEKVFHRSILGFNAHLVLLKEGEMSDPAHEAARLKKALAEQWKSSTPFLYREVLLVSEGRVKGAVLKGIDPLTFSEVYAVKVRPGIDTQVPANIRNLLQAPGEFPRLVLGRDLAEELGIRAEGKTIKVFVPAPPEAGKKTPGSFQVFEVGGIFETGLYEFDHGFAFVDIGKMQGVFGVPGRATGIEAKLHDPREAEVLSEQLKKNFRLPYDVVSWQKLNAPLFRALKLERILFFIVMAMIVVVAAFNIVGVLLLMIFDKSREISILRALGAPERGLKTIFAWTGLALGGVGSLLGLLLGGGIAWLLHATDWVRPAKEIYLVDRLPIDFSFGMIAAVVGSSLLISLIATRIGVARLKASGLDL